MEFAGLMRPQAAFWSCDARVLDPAVVDATRVHGPRQRSDTYLRALAFAHDGRCITVNQRIALDAVHSAEPRHLVAL